MLTDTFGRPRGNLRLSVTDRCNLRCSYCMPEPEYVWLPREDILHFEEIQTLVDVFVGLGVSKVRLTGGEPLLRRGLPDLIAGLAGRSGITDRAVGPSRLASVGSSGPSQGFGYLSQPAASIQTSIGGPELHRTVVGLLDYLKQAYMPDLQVSDETRYWDQRDEAELKRHMDARR